METSTPTSVDNVMMEKALEEARNAITDGKAGVGALLLYRDEILSIGHNSFEETGDITAHAEMTLFRRLAQRLSSMSDEEKADLTLYTTLELCLMCLSASSLIGIKRIVFSAWNEDGEESLQVAHNLTLDDVNQRLVRGPIEIIPSVRREEGKEILAMMGKE